MRSSCEERIKRKAKNSRLKLTVRAWSPGHGRPPIVCAVSAKVQVYRSRKSSSASICRPCTCTAATLRPAGAVKALGHME
jgi:hypothetical protein